MSRQQNRAIERKKGKTALQKICIAAGEGVGKAMAFRFALASNAFAAEPKKEEPITLPQWSCRIKAATTLRNRPCREYLSH